MTRLALPALLRRAFAAPLLLAALTAISASDLAAQVTQSAGGTSAAAADPKTKRPLTIADYSRWRTIEGAQLSGDGRWVAYGLRFANVVTPDAKPELHIRNLDTNQEIVVKDGSSATFSSDSRWVVYQIEPPPPPRNARRVAGADSTADSTRARDTTATPKRRAELRELATGRTQSWEDIQSATFSPTASHLLLRRRPPTGSRGGSGAGEGQGGGGGGFGGQQSGAAPNIRGTDALLHELSTGRTQFLGSVGDAAFNRRGDLLAFSVEANLKDGNGLFVADLATGRTHVLDNDARTYSRLTWNDSGTGVAVLKGKDVPKMREKENALLVVPAVRTAFASATRVPSVRLDSAAAGFPRGWVISDRATLDWSDDSRRVFFGAMRQTAAPDTGKRRSTDSLPDVDVWRTQDERIVSLQMIRADADRNFTFREALDVASGRFVRLADSTMREVEVAPDGRWAIGRDIRGYVADYGRPRADIYRVNPATGERTLVLKGQPVQQHVFGFSPDGRGWLYWKDEKIQRYDLDANTTRTLGSNAPSFINAEWDYPGLKPSYGIAGFTADGRGVIAHHRYDLWLLPLDGSAARNLTNGEGGKNEIQFRVVRTTPPDPMAPRLQREGRLIDLARPVTLSAYGEWTKKSGYYTLTGNRLEPVVYDDAAFSTPMRAARAERYLFTRQTFVEFPDLRVSGPAFAQARKISDANPQQAEFIWGRRVLFDYTLKDGKRAQGILAIPDDYRDGEKRPMIVTFYEKNSQNMHRHTPPSFIASLNATPVEAMSRGYLFMLPDVYFRTGQSHSDMLEAVEAATRKVIELGYADPKRIGVHGHSYSGEGAAFIATQSKMFAAVGMGAGVTDLTSDFSQSWGWAYQVNAGSGQNAFEYYLNSQGRWGFSPWDKPEVYRFESALTHAPAVQVPILIMHGTADPTVAFSEGMNFYSALRYNNKTAYLLAYPGEGHGLRGLANRRDLTIRYFQFFDHYLKGTPAPKWMTEGVPYLLKDEVKEPK